MRRRVPSRTCRTTSRQFRWPRVDDAQNFYPHLSGDRGCHFSYLGFGTERIAAKVAAFSHSEYLFAMDEAHHLMTVCDDLALDQYGRARQPGAGLLTVLQPSEWSDLHRWMHDQQPEWFDTHRPGNLTWRLMNAAVIDDAMLSNDLTKIRVLGGPRVLLEQSAWRSIRSRLGRIRRRLADR